MFLNKSSTNHHSDDFDIPMFVRRKKYDDKENDMVVAPMACDGGKIFDIFNVGN